MGGLLVKKEETAFFVVCFLILFASKSTAIFLVAVVALFTLFLYRRKELYFLFSILAPRITGDAPILRYLLKLAREEGPGNQQLPDLLQISIPFMPPIVFIFKREYVKRILAVEPDNFPSGGEQGPMVKILASSGKNILLSPGPPSPHWAKYRRITSNFNKDRLGDTSLVASLFDQTWKTTQELSTSHFSNKLNTPIDLFYELFHVMLPAHNRALFGEDTARKFSYKDLSHEMYDIITETGKQLKFDWCPPNLQTAYKGKLSRVQQAVRSMMFDSTSRFVKPLLESYKEGSITEEELMSNIMVYEYAQAPLHVVFWLLYALSTHPEEEKKVIDEISSILSEGPLTYERISEFKYLSKVVSETLRIYPGVGLMQVRFPTSHCYFGEHFVPKGAYVFLCNYLIQRNATYWSKPDEFIPDREGIDPALYGQNLAYIPFGNGPRQCQGQYFALNFVKVAVISMLQKYKITLCPGQSAVTPTEIGFLRPTQPVFFKLEKRVLPTPAPKYLSTMNLAGGETKIMKDLLVLYGSQTRTAQRLATRFAQMAEGGKLSVTLKVLSEFDVNMVRQHRSVVVVTSTYGNGGAPENAEKFESWLEKETSTDLFSGIPVAVLALGSSMYPFPFKFGMFVSRRLSQLGAVQLIPEEKLDAVNRNTQDVFNSWSAKVFGAVANNQNFTDQANTRQLANSF